MKSCEKWFDEERKMRLETKLLAGWPKLAWVAKASDGDNVISIYHGPYVEVGDDWIVEAVWAGSFKEGDFDQTDLVFGTGVRCRKDSVVFVTSGTVFDRIWHGRHQDKWYFSNSLPALMAVAGLSFLEDYSYYSKAAGSIVHGIDKRIATIPVSSTDLTSVYFNNISFNGKTVEEIPKPDKAPAILDYNEYKKFLFSTAKRLGENLRSENRNHRISTLTSISSGYDSSASAVIAREAGCGDSVTIDKSSSLWRGSDSGVNVAKHLGLSCKEYPLMAKEYPSEAAVWASEGKAGVLNWTLFDYPEPLCLFFTGCHGEKMWDRVLHDHPDPFVRRDTSSLGFCEFRLFQGVFQCVVPFWGVRHSMELRKVTESQEMSPWYRNVDYDKPAARRILQEAGVPGHLFGTRKKNTSHEASFKWPYSKDDQESYETFLEDRGITVLPKCLIPLIRLYSKIDSLIYKNTIKKFGIARGQQFWLRISNPNLIFQWANNELKRFYEVNLEEK